MPFSKELLDILVCPETKQELALADDNILGIINSRIGEGRLKNRSGETVKERVNGALVRKDGKYLYLIREDIPIMIIDEAVPMDQVK